jgi:hypothetical protein
VPRLAFPTDRIVGDLDWDGAYTEKAGPVLATGPVDAPDGVPIRLSLMEYSGAQPVPRGGWTMQPTGRATDLRFLSQLPRDAIESLEMHHVVADSFGAVVHLAPGLRQLLLTGTDLDDDAIPYLAQLRGLRHLEMIDNRFTDQGLRQLRVLDDIEYVCLEQDEGLTLAAFDFATELPKLKELESQDSPLTARERDQLQESLPQVRIWY